MPTPLLTILATLACATPQPPEPSPQAPAQPTEAPPMPEPQTLFPLMTNETFEVPQLAATVFVIGGSTSHSSGGGLSTDVELRLTRDDHSEVLQLYGGEPVERWGHRLSLRGAYGTMDLLVTPLDREAGP